MTNSRAGDIVPVLREKDPMRPVAKLATLTIGLSAIFIASCIASGTAAFTLKSLHSFCTKTNCADGSAPIGGLVADASGNLYGVTLLGGTFGVDSTQGGTVFELSPNADGSWTHTVLHNFCARASCADGNLPFFGLIVGANGALYGTTQAGGAYNSGVAFILTPN